MDILDTPQVVQDWRASLPAARKVGMVPTMGFLHDGHLSLIDRARELVPHLEGDLVLTIFVNPTQFGAGEDLDRYPSDREGDLAKARAHGVDVVFAPRDPALMYPSMATWVDVDGLGDHLCGASRPGHFRGVCTVVAKLFSLVRPDVAVFGEKDIQQLTILRRMHADLFLSGEIVSMPIVREADGLAMSSRNARLSGQARGEALAIVRFLEAVRERFEAGERVRDGLLGDVEQTFAAGRLDYVELVDAASLQPVTVVEGPAIVAVAAHFGGVRLIDNLQLHP